MPIDMGVLGYQQRSARQGEIRIGDSVVVDGKKGRQPRRLRTFKFTVPTEAMAEKVAALYGGEVVPWDRKEGYFGVVTAKSAIEVYVPVRGTVTDSMMELWDGPVRKRWCDGRTERMSGTPCKCPLDRAERERLSKLLHPEACKPRTKIRVTIPELPGLGQFQLSTGSVNALEETGDASKVMEVFRDADGAWVPAVLRIEWRQRVGDASPYPVPVLEIGASLVQIARHEVPAGNDSLMRQLRASGPQRAAIEAGATPLSPAPRGLAGEDGAGEVVDAVIVSDWLDTALAAAMTLASEAEGRKLWRDAAEKAHAGEIAPADARSIQELITARLADLREAPAPGALLDDGDPWAVKVEGIVSEQDAADALAELDERVTAGSVNQDHAGRVRAAVLARFPGAAA